MNAKPSLKRLCAGKAQTEAISNGHQGAQRGGPRQRSSFGDSNLAPQNWRRGPAQRRGNRFDTALLGKMEMRREYVEALRKSFNDRN